MGHPHLHDHSHASSSGMTLPEKIHKLLDHWVQHNHSHAATYRQWAAQADANGLDRVAVLLDQAANQTDAISAVFESAHHALSEALPD